MIELSPGAEYAWRVAALEAASLRHPAIEREHIGLGICSIGKIVDSDADSTSIERLRAENDQIERLLKGFQVSAQQLRRLIRGRLMAGNAERTGGPVHRSEACKAVFARAAVLAESSKFRDVRALHLLQAILEDPGDSIAAALSSAGINMQELSAQISRSLVPNGLSTPTLARYGRDLTLLGTEGKLPSLVGRRDEMLQIIRILSQDGKRNPVLTGEAGVGKTAIVEGVAQRIAAGKNLPGRRIIELNLGSLVGGTKYRGEFEDRITQILDEVRANPEVIVFLDELHTLVGAGGASGGLDAANMLKPALARGELTCIGATTTAEYRRVIERDAALDRRFQPVLVREPSPEEALEILTGLKEKIESHHGQEGFILEISDSALQTCVELSVRYLTDRQLPDKALDILRRACARVRFPALSMPLGQSPDSGLVTPKVIAEVVSELTNRPVGTPGQQEAQRLAEMEAFLSQRVIGQNHAIDRVAAVIRRASAGLKPSRRPLGVFLFLGPTGVGKTLLAKALAEFLFGSEDDLIRLDMSEYKEKHSVAKLIGAPPGYIGHDDEGQLTAKLRTKPWSVVLLDEIEKAHTEVLDLFLQLFDEGRLTDSKGRTIDGSHAIFVLTSNLPPHKRMGFDVNATQADVETTLEEVREYFRPEFFNRLDEQILFLQLGKQQVRQIVQAAIRTFGDLLLRNHGATLELDDGAIEWIVQRGCDVRYGAREVNRCFERSVGEPLSRMILEEGLRKHDHVLVQLTHDGSGLAVTVEAAGTV